MSKKKGMFKTPQTLDQSAQAKIAAFTSGGRAEHTAPTTTTPTPAAPKKSKRGRPSLEEDTRRTVMALRKDDVQRVEELCLRWKRESDGLVSIKTTMVLRSLLAECLPKLERLEGIEDEAHLREMIRTLVK